MSELRGLVVHWLGRRTCDQQVASSIEFRPFVAGLVLGWVTVCGRVNHLGM